MEQKKLYKSTKDKKLFGVCAGMAEYFNVDVTLIRLIWIFAVCGFGIGGLAYLVAALVLPEKDEK